MTSALPVPPAETAPSRRLVIVGSTGSGKTTLARTLAGLLGVPHVELDALHWEPEWTPAAPEVFRRRVALATAGPAWVVDGNYRAIRDLVWPRAETVVWLDYSLPVIYRRLAPRTFGRLRSRETLWGSNRERLRNQFRRDGLFIWVLRTYWRRRRDLPRALRLPEHAHLRLVRLRRPDACDAWLAALPRRDAPAGTAQTGAGAAIVPSPR